jgi:N-ethylmaleimide reductase
LSGLFTRIRAGAFNLTHRVVLAPLTRMRSETPGNVPGFAMATYYEKRATRGGFLIGEATFVSRQGNGGFGSPGIENDEQAAVARSRESGARERRHDGVAALACRPGLALQPSAG